MADAVIGLFPPAMSPHPGQNHDLLYISTVDHLDSDLSSGVRCCAGSVECIPLGIQPRKPVLYHANYTAPTRQHELDRTDQGSVCPQISRSRTVGIGDLSDVLIDVPLGCLKRADKRVGRTSTAVHEEKQENVDEK